MLRIFLKLVFLLLIIAVAGGISYYWLENKPRAKRETPKRIAPMVSVLEPKFKDHTVSVYSMGNVVPAQLVNLTSRISGLVVSVSKNFIEGGFLNKGEEIVSLDPTDYLLQVALRESDVQRAKAKLALELGQQKVARIEAKLLGRKLSKEESNLVLRKPYLAIAKAELATAETQLKQAKLDLSRTHTVAPFNSIVISRNANIGSWVSTFSTGTPLVKLVGVDSFWIDMSLPVDKLSWITIPNLNAQRGSEVQISYKTGWGAGKYRVGRVKRLKAEVEAEGRMAKLIIEVDDPLSQKSKNKHVPLLTLGTFVRLKIKGKTLKQVLELPEKTLRDGDHLWLLSPENTFQIHKVDPVWKEQGFVYITANQIPANAKIIVSDLSAPVVGMTLQQVKVDAVIKEVN